jgi:hypothetical protein
VGFGAKPWSVPYDQATESYRLRRWNIGGFLEIRAKGDSAFYEIEREADRSMFVHRYRRFRQTGAGHILPTPIRWGKSLYRFHGS